MNLTIKTTKTTLTPAIRSAIENKLSSLKAFLHSEDKIHVELDVDTHHKTGLVHRAEIQIKPHGHYAEVRANNFYEALDLLIPKIKEQLTKEKDKRISLRRKLGRKRKQTQI